jgi:uncharacterized membrane protein YebE (DUF533 family)
MRKSAAGAIRLRFRVLCSNPQFSLGGLGALAALAILALGYSAAWHTKNWKDSQTQPGSPPTHSQSAPQLQLVPP